MSRNRAKYLVELTKDKHCVSDNGDINSQQPDESYERDSSPHRGAENVTNELMAMLNHVFEEPIEVGTAFNSIKKTQTTDRCNCSPNQSSTELADRNSDIVLEDVNLHMMASESPMAETMVSDTDKNQRACPMTMTPTSIEPLFSVITNNEDHYSKDCTPAPSPSSDFMNSPQNLSADETLTPSTSRDVDITLTNENVQEVLNLDQVGPNNDNSETNSISETISACGSVSSTTTFNESDYTAESTPINKRKSKKRTDAGSKRLKHKEDWIAIKRKRLCNIGQSYTSTKGVSKGARKMKSSCKSCRLRCSATISETTRTELFTNFWSSGSHTKQWKIIAYYVLKKPKKMSSNPEGENSRRVHTLHYHLPLNNLATEASLQKVCKTMFLNTFDISKDFVYTALRKHEECNQFSEITDDRGRHTNHKLIITNDMKQSVIDHVNSFTPIESHYVRKRSSKKYLDSSLSFTKMFEMYPDWCAENNHSTKVQTLRQYRDIVNTNLKIGFYVPKKDQCDLCHQFKNITNPSEDQKNKYEKHQAEKEMSRKLKLENKLLPITNKKIACIVFDFQKVLSAPSGNISVYYYKRKLNVYNFTIYDMANKEAYCYMWDEQTARRGANEVASCLYDFFKKLNADGVSQAFLWSDNCGGQNRNRIVYYMYLLAADKFNMKINHRFMEKGHTQNEGDSVHALIEKTARGKEIYSPDEWYALVRWAKVNEKPYNVVEVKQDMIYDFKTCIARKNWTKNVNNEKVAWNKMKEVQVSHENYGVLGYRYSLISDDLNHIHCFKKSTRLSSQEPFPGNAYKGLLKISKAKYNDLKYYCDNNIIPEKYHSFYANLLKEEQIINDDDNTDEDDE